MPHERYRSLIGSIVITAGGITIADINAYLGCVSLIIGIIYQIWIWRCAWVKSKEK